MNPLDELPPIVLPAEPGWWPPAPGWLIIAFLLLCSLTLLVYLLIKRRRKLALKKNILGQLQQLYSNLDTRTGPGRDISRQQFVDRAAVLLRQFCIQQYGAELFASVTGDQWLEKMDELAEGNYLNNRAGKMLVNRYRYKTEHSMDEIDELYKALNDWLANTTVNRQAISDSSRHNLCANVPHKNNPCHNNRNAFVNRS